MIILLATSVRGVQADGVECRRSKEMFSKACAVVRGKRFGRVSRADSTAEASDCFGSIL
jgi:hypothetical protein